MQHVVSAPSRPTSIALIDLSYLFKKRYHTIGNSTPMAAAKATVEDLIKLRRGVGHVIICRDAPPYKRAEIYEAYKATRPKPEPEETAQRRYVFEEIKRLGFNVAWAEGYEADDVIATLAREYGEWCDDVRIVGTDKDMAQCLNEQVTQFIPPVGDKDWEVRDVKAATEKFGVPPELMTFFQGLCGDKGDNIPGVKGVGEVKARQLANTYKTVEALAEGLVSKPHNLQPATERQLHEGWANLVLSVKLATLDAHVPIDSESLLVKREEEPEKPMQNILEVPFDGFIGNQTPSPPANEIGSAESREALREASRVYAEAQPRIQAAKDADLLEKESDRERAENEEHEAREAAEQEQATTSGKAPERMRQRVGSQTAIVTAPTVTQSKYGLVTADLQPLDLDSAYTLSTWFHRGGLYTKKFKNEAQLFTIIAKARELGIKTTIALDNFHIIEGKPSTSADLIRALAERDPSFEYLMPIEIGDTKVIWQGKRKGQPRHVDFAYTIEDAKKAGLLRSGNYADTSNWTKRPQDMLMKTAGSKLARVLWPAATMGLYCPEEMGYTAEEIEAREAA